jgi:hypothetical protein
VYVCVVPLLTRVPVAVVQVQQIILPRTDINSSLPTKMYSNHWLLYILVAGTRGIKHTDSSPRHRAEY